MLNACFYFLVSMSISSTVVIVVLLLLRKITVIPKRWLYPLWSIALLRMVIPVAVSSSVSIFNGFRDLVEMRMPVRTVVFKDAAAVVAEDEAAAAGSTAADPADRYDNKDESEDRYDKEVVLSVLNCGGYAAIRNDNRNVPAGNSTYPNIVAISQYYYPLQYKTARLAGIFKIGTFIWITGVLILMAIIYILYAVLFHQYKHPFHLREEVYHDMSASSPFLLGIRKPKIILPAGLDADSPQASHIIAHERVHIKRRDNLWRLVGLAATCLHWFNPVAWIGYSCFLKDMEFSCDEIVIKNYTGSRRKEYAQALLAVGERSHRQNPIPAAFGKTSTGSRIMSVLTFQKLSWLGTFMSVLFLLMIAAMLITNAQI